MTIFSAMPDFGGRGEKYPCNMGYQYPITASMEQLIADVEAYAASVDRKPQAVLRDAIGAGWKEWESWKAGKSSPTMARVDRLRDYMAGHPPQEDAA
ncbi:hypothetical protein R2601_23890 [Salipiger bermudensis HTCC2601]|uniref:Uncharacterized protein n=2 Tax=Salipiger TaxID=263377 RepID=Q0FIA1_SALBH|nr:hypothetical protein R2601_23890 [Salipiger bermudensis HTCC2601]